MIKNVATRGGLRQVAFCKSIFEPHDEHDKDEPIKHPFKGTLRGFDAHLRASRLPKSRHITHPSVAQSIRPVRPNFLKIFIVEQQNQDVALFLKNAQNPQLLFNNFNIYV